MWDTNGKRPDDEAPIMTMTVHLYRSMNIMNVPSILM